MSETAAHSDLMALADDKFEEKLSDPDYAKQAAISWRRHALRLAASQSDRDALARIMRGHIEYGFDGPMARQESIIGIDEAADAILSLLSGAGTKSDGGEPMPERTQARLAGLDEGLGPMQAIPQAADDCAAPSDPSPGQRKAHNDSILARMRGVEQHPATPESDADPRNPTQRNDNAPSPGPDVRRRVLDILNAVAPAVENLVGHQEQCDMDGVMVKVSRQALDEVLNAVNEVALVSALTRPLGGLCSGQPPRPRPAQASAPLACRGASGRAPNVHRPGAGAGRRDRPAARGEPGLRLQGRAGGGCQSLRPATKAQEEVMPISPLRIKAPKPVATPQCSAPVDPPSHAPEWRKERYKRLRPSYNPDCCQRDSSIVIDGKNYCRLHAGGIALDRWLRGEIK